MQTNPKEYWRQQMDAAYAFMSAIMEYPVAECGEPLVGLPEAVKSAGVRVEFSTSRIGGRFDRLFYLREGLVPRFLAAARAMNARGWVLKVEDGFRTCAMQKQLAQDPAILARVVRSVLWETGGRRPDGKFLFRRVTAMVATAPKIGTHLAGSAMDVSVLQASTGVEVDRGGPYLEMSEKTPMESPFVSAEARANRQAITSLMREHGFVTYPFEFWHYCGGDAYEAYLLHTGQPGRYGPVDFDPATGRVTAVENKTAPLVTPAELRTALEQVPEYCELFFVSSPRCCRIRS